MHQPHAAALCTRLSVLACAALCVALPARAAIVINEVDYDQVGTDTQEFVELYNNGATAVSLAGLSLRLINGANNAQYGQVDLPGGVLAPGAYFVICNVNSAVPNCNLPALAASDSLQNGAPDGLALVDNGALQVISTLSYEGAVTAAVLTGLPGTYNLVNGTPTALADNNTTAGIGLSRLPNGVDTHNDATDWALIAITPGSENGAAPVPEPATAALWLGGLAALAGLQRRRRN